MTIVFSRNTISIEEHEKVIEHGDWVRVQLQDMPECFRNIPEEKVEAVFASGSQLYPSSEGSPVCGMDVIRIDHKDEDQGGLHNIDHYDGYLSRSSDGTPCIVLTKRIRRDDHWCKEIPEAYHSQITVSFKERQQ